MIEDALLESSMNTLSLEERADVLIALSIVFDRRTGERDRIAPERAISKVVGDSLRSLNSPRREKVIERAAELGSLSDFHLQRWLGRSIDNVRRRGSSTKLDQHINAEQIAKVLKNEPHPIRRSILNYLPFDLSQDVERLLDPVSGVHSVNDEFLNDLPPEIIEVVKRRFLANFVQIESVCDANALDELSGDELRQFIRFLGLREIAVACRGIKSKEKIAAFLCRFAEEDAKEIAMYLSNLDQVEPIWVSIADRIVQRLWNRRLRPHQIVHKIGLELLARAYAERSNNAARYTSQKLSCRDAARLEKMIVAWKERLNDPDTRMVEIERKRAEVIAGMAGKFKEKGSL
jgi:hypothetical protein